MNFFYNFDEKINNFIYPISDSITGLIFWEISFFQNNLPLIVVWLVLASIFFTFYFRFINISAFSEGLKVAFGKYDKKSDPGEITPFQSFTAAMSGTIGLGNIAGVAVAISIGGPGAMFWMIVMAFFGMTLKFVEVSLGHKYRIIHKDGTVSGGAIRYLSEGFSEKGFPKIGKMLAVVFAICCIGGSFGGGNMFQANQAFQQILEATGGKDSILYGKAWLGGILFAFVVGLIIVGGIKSIGKVTEKLVPIMGIFYVVSCLYIICSNLTLVPETIEKIFLSAFSTDAGFGGIIGTMIAGIRRAVFSNESGIGSAPIAYAPAKSKNHLNPGFMSLLSPVIDTIVVCSMTALVIIITGSYLEFNQIEGVALTSRAFQTIAPWFPILLAFAISLFAISTLITWSYYGLTCWTFLFGQTKRNQYIFQFIFLFFTVVGTTMNLSSVINFSDAMIFAMSVPNIIGLYFLAPQLKNDLRKIKK